MENWIWWQWLLFVLGILLGIYVLVFFIVLGSVLSFKKKIHKRSAAISLLFAQRHDILDLIFKLFTSNGIVVPSTIASYLDESINYDTDLNNKTRDDIISKLNKASQGLLYLSDEHENIKNSSQFIEYRKTLSELDDAYRQNVARYNSDITGYNYWVNFVSYRLIFKMFKLNQKDIIV